MNNKFGIKGILQDLDINSFLKMERFWLTIAISIFILILCVHSGVYVLDVLDVVTTNALGAFPSLIGCCITAYALILGFGNPEILEDAILKRRNKFTGEADTFYIYLSRRMSIYILFFIVSFILTYIVNIIIKSKITITFLDNIYIILVINSIILCIILSAIIFSFMLMMDIVYAIFNYSFVYISQYSKKYQMKKNKKYINDAIPSLNDIEQDALIKILQFKKSDKTEYLKTIINEIDDKDIIDELLDYMKEKKNNS